MLSCHAVTWHWHTMLSHLIYALNCYNMFSFMRRVVTQRCHNTMSHHVTQKKIVTLHNFVVFSSHTIQNSSTTLWQNITVTGCHGDTHCQIELYCHKTESAQYDVSYCLYTVISCCCLPQMMSTRRWKSWQIMSICHRSFPSRNSRGECNGCRL